ncbi:hypothetical protein BU17DRAFT_46876 [Hysterangium stoloniferum]|nr:hypothetical protein BU17DRAFT_46876 [Hysterangium stoloniferum]
MTYARSAPPYSNPHAAIPPIQQSASTPTSPFFIQQYRSSVSSTDVSPPLASPRPPHKRSASTPSSPTLTDSGRSNPAAQCSGTTKSGKRCTRTVRAVPLVSVFAPESSEPVERFCYQHAKEIMEPTGFYSHKKNGGWVEFSEWIPSYLHPDTQAALRVEMEKPASDKDEAGYIYAFEIRDDSSDEIRLKVGRAVKLVKRLDEWAKQCSSKEVILRGWWPGTVEDQDISQGTSLLRGTVKAGEAGPLCHRLERLVHLELADLAVHAPYLKEGFPRVNGESGASPPSTPTHSPKKSSKAKTQIRKCADCGQMHKEIFTFRRAEQGRYKNAEWERLVKPVILKWGGFIRDFV